MMDLLVMLGAAALFAAAFVAFRPLLLGVLARRAARQDAEPVPMRWENAVRRALPQSRAFPRTDQTRLLTSVRDMVTTLHWEGCGGLTLTEDMRIDVASQAALLAMHLPGEPFPRLREVLVYPRAFIPRRTNDPRSWIDAAGAPPVPELGEAWTNGVIVLSWESALDRSRHPHDGRNVVYHEFAHQLAFEHGLVPDVSTLSGEATVPSSAIVPDPARWTAVLTAGYESLGAKLEDGDDTVLDAYGATNLDEFFAVATEAFFERPAALREEYPDLYDQLRAVYRQDPASWGAAERGSSEASS